MSNRLGGKQGTAYTGTNANQPPNWTFNDRDPNDFDIQNVSIGDMWLNEANETVWVLVSLAGDMVSKGSLATWQKLESSSGSLDTLTGDSGGAITPDGLANINLVSGIVGFSFDGNPGTNTITLNSTGGPGDVVQEVTGNSGGPVGPTLGNINIVGDGTTITIAGNPGTSTLTASVIGGGGGATSFPTDDGTANDIGGVLNIITDNAALQAGSSVLFSGTSNTVLLEVTDADDNTIIGLNSGNLTLSGTNNTVLGSTSAPILTTGSSNVVIGGTSASSLTTGQRNVIIGAVTGNNYTGAESSNIVIGNQVGGILGESNTLRIGVSTGTGNGQLNASFIHGIRGITPAAADGIPVFIDSSGQLGTVGAGGLLTTLTGNTGGAVSGTAGNINVIGDGATITVTGNPGTSTLTVSLVGGGIGAQSFPTDDGTATEAAGILNIIADNASLNAGATVLFSGASNTITLDVSDDDDNTIIGSDSGNLTYTPGVALANTVCGSTSLRGLTTGSNNSVFGSFSASLITTGLANTIIGEGSGISITTGNRNLIVGSVTGNAYTSTESNNIIIGNLVTGTLGESNALRIGLSTGAGNGQINKTFIQGIRGITPAAGNGVPVFIDSNGQLGTVGIGGATIDTVTGNSGGPVGPTLGNVNIVGDGTTITIVGSPGTSTLTASVIGGGGGTTVFDGDDGTATPAGGVIEIIADTAALHCGATVSFDASGNEVLLNVTDTNGNTIIGEDSGNLAYTGTNNTVVGGSSLISLTTGNINSIFGQASALNLTTGSGNSIFGGSVAANLITGEDNTILGSASALNLTSGLANTIIGQGSATLLVDGTNNIFLGSTTGNSYTTTESSNIIIGNLTPGVVGDSNTLRIGLSTGLADGQLNKAFIHGILNIIPDIDDAIPVFISSNGQLTTEGVELAEAFDGDTGSGATPTNGIINIIANTAAKHAGSTVSFSTSGNTILFNVTDASNNTIMGLNAGNTASSGTFNTVFGATSAPVITTGGSNTIFGSVSAGVLSTGTLNTILGGGSGAALTTGQRNTILGAVTGNNYTSSESRNIVIGNSVTGVTGESNVLRIGLSTGTGNGQLNKAFVAGIRGITTGVADAIPVFIDSSGQLGTAGGFSSASSFTTDSGTAIPSAGIINILASKSTKHAGSTVSFSGSANIVLFNVTDGSNNTIMGLNAGNLTLSGSNNSVYGANAATAFTTGGSNVIYGVSAANSITTGAANAIYGTSAAPNMTTGSSNVVVGSLSASALTTGISNNIVGRGSGTGLTTGQRNVIVGTTSGNNFTSSESDNIIIGATVTGTTGNSNSLRIGSGTGTGNGQLNKSFIHGIRGVTPTINDGIPVFVNSVGQLGTVGTGGGGGGGSISSFFAYLNTTVFGATGDGTIYQIIYDTKPFDLGGDFNLGTSVFTAPITGLYNFAFGVFCEGTFFNGSSQNPSYVTLTTSTKIFSRIVNTPVTSGISGFSLKYSQTGSDIYTNMTAGDTAFVTVKSGSLPATANVQVDGTTTGPFAPSTTGIVNFFGGSLVS